MIQGEALYDVTARNRETPIEPGRDKGRQLRKKIALGECKA